MSSSAAVSGGGLGLLELIPFIANNNNIFLQLAGFIILLTVSMALRMSLYRLAFAGKNKKPSPQLQTTIDNFYDNQMLCSEWAPIGIALSLGLHLKYFVSSGAAKNTDDKICKELAVLAMLVWIGARLVFHSKVVISLPFVLSAGSMTVCYLASFVAGGILVFA